MLQNQRISTHTPFKANTLSDAPFVSFPGFHEISHKANKANEGGKTCYWKYCDARFPAQMLRWLIHPFSSGHHRLQNWFCFKARVTGKESKSNKDTVVWMITVSGTSREPVGHSAQLTPHVLTTLRPPPQIKSQTFRSTYPEGKRWVSCCSSCLIKSSSYYLSSLFSFPMTSVSWPCKQL